MKVFSLLVGILFACQAHAVDPTSVRGLLAQQWIKIGGTGAASSVAALDINSTTKGVMLPRMTTTQQNAIAGTLEGLLIYDNVLHQPAVNNGSSWLDLFNASNFTAGTLAVAQGGTGNGSLATTAGGFLYTDGSKVMNLGACSSGNVVVSNGSSAPTCGTVATNPMNAAGQMIYGGTGGAASSLAAGTSGQVLVSNGTSAPAFTTLTAPTRTVKTSLKLTARQRAQKF